MKRLFPALRDRLLRDGLLALAFPQDCRVCGGAVDSFDDGVACDGCWQDTRITQTLLAAPVCFRCGLPTHTFTSTSFPRSEAAVCGECAELPFAAARAAAVYGGAVEASLLFLKTQPTVCARLARLIREVFAEHAEALECDVIIPAPLHPTRLRERGFNQAEVIARVLTRGFHLPVDTLSLRRIKPTERHRAGMDHADRLRSVEGAFRVARPNLVRGTAVLLIDDVYTTGSTLGEAARAILEAGASRVAVFTVARVLERSRAPLSRGGV